MIPIELIDRLRAWFFARDRDISLQSNRTVTLGDGRIVDEHVVPSGGVIFWPSTAGAIPSGWTTFSAASGRFLVGAGGSFSNGSTGGAETIDIQHSHTPGTLAISSEGHTHGPGTLAWSSESHSHGNGTLALADDTHHHDNLGSGRMQLGASSGSTNVDQFGTPQTGVALDGHIHELEPLLNATGDDTHGHTISGSSGADAHSHTAASGTTASDSHNHSLSGSTATALSSAQSILPPYLIGTWIQKS